MPAGIRSVSQANCAVGLAALARRLALRRSPGGLRSDESFGCNARPARLVGGDHVRLTVNEANAIVEFDCAHGTLDQPVVTDRDGRFDVAGTFVREHGGPSRPDEVLDRHPARYVGVMAGNKMTLTTTTTDEPQTLGPFALVQGVYPKLIKCL